MCGDMRLDKQSSKLFKPNLILFLFDFEWGHHETMARWIVKNKLNAKTCLQGF